MSSAMYFPVMTFCLFLAAAFSVAAQDNDFDKKLESAGLDDLMLSGLDGDAYRLPAVALANAPAIALWSDCAHALNAAYALDPETEEAIMHAVGFEFADGTTVAVHLNSGGAEASAAGFSAQVNSANLDLDTFDSMKLQYDSGVLQVFYTKAGEFGPSLAISTTWLRVTVFLTEKKNSLRVMVEVLSSSSPMGSAHGLLSQTAAAEDFAWTEASFAVAALLETDFEFVRFGTCDELAQEARYAAAKLVKDDLAGKAVAKRASSGPHISVKMGLSTVTMDGPMVAGAAVPAADSATAGEDNISSHLVPNKNVILNVGKSTIRARVKFNSVDSEVPATDSAADTTPPISDSAAAGENENSGRLVPNRKVMLMGKKSAVRAHVKFNSADSF